MEVLFVLGNGHMEVQFLLFKGHVELLNVCW